MKVKKGKGQSGVRSYRVLIFRTVYTSFIIFSRRKVGVSGVDFLGTKREWKGKQVHADQKDVHEGGEERSKPAWKGKR